MLWAMAEEHKGIMRSLGEFFGHIARGIATDPSKPPRRTVVREETTEQERMTDDGQRVILRRTVIEEVEMAPGHSPAPVAGRAGDEPQKGAAK